MNREFRILGRRKRLRSAAGLLLWLGASLAALLPAAQAQVASAEEQQIKAAFLYNFAKFVEWPSSAFPSANSPLIIGVLAEDGFATVVERIVAGKTAQGRPLTVSRLKEVSRDSLHCHIVFVGSSERGAIADLLQLTKGTKVLTVSETDGFVQRGGALNFVIVENKVRFEVNNLTAKNGGLRISAKLLQLATNVWE